MQNQSISIFENNIKELFHINTFLATKIFAIDTNSRYEVFQGKDPIDINFLDSKTNEFIYSYPADETEAFLEEHKGREKLPFRYFFGIGNGVAISAYLKLSHIQRILVIEPDIELLYVALNLFDFSKEIASKKLVLDIFEHMDYPNANFYLMHTEGKIYVKLFELEILSDYYIRVFGKELEELSLLMTKTIETNVISHGNDMIDSLMGVENHIVNLPDMVKSIPLKNLSVYKPSNTGIVVSTGPSLSKQIPLLKKIQKYVTIICVDASFPILERHGIKPDFVTILERVPETAKFFEHNEPAFQKNVNFVAVSYVDEKVKKAITNSNVVMVMRPNEYLKYFELDTFGYIGMGMSAANLAHELGIALDIKNIILIGQDLAFGEDNTSHAEGHMYGENEENIDGHELFIEKYGGVGEIRTTKYWILFKQGFEKTISKYKESNHTINSTEGGARINGATELSFQEAIDKYVNYDYKKERASLKYATSEKQKEYTQQFIDKTNYWITDSIKNQELVEEVFMRVQEASEEFVKMKEDERLDELENDYLLGLLEDIDKVKALFDEETFSNLYTNVLQSYILNLEMDLAPITLEPAKTDIEKKGKMVKWILKHRYWLFIVAGGIDATRVTILRAIKKWPKKLQNQIVKLDKKEVEIDLEKYEKLKKRLKEQEEAKPEST